MVGGTEPGTSGPGGLRRALDRYRLMSYVVGVMLLVMVCVGLPLQYLGHEATLPQVGWTVHGALYVVYLITAADLARRARFSLWQLVGVVCAGFLPGLAFVVERRTTLRIRNSGAGDPTPASILDEPPSRP